MFSEYLRRTTDVVLGAGDWSRLINLETVCGVYAVMVSPGDPGNQVGVRAYMTVLWDFLVRLDPALMALVDWNAFFADVLAAGFTTTNFRR